MNTSQWDKRDQSRMPVRLYSGTAERQAQRKQLTAGKRTRKDIDLHVDQTELPSENQSDIVESLLEPDTIIGGTFRIISLLGVGGMGIVYLAEHVVLRKKIALKVLARELVNQQNWVRFKTEARLLANLNHPSLVSVYDLGIDQGIPFYAMDFLIGKSLEEILLAGPMPASKAIEIFIALLDGLQYAHERGIVHRDIKPSNIFVCRDDSGTVVKILDFGISKLLSGDKQNLTAFGETFGSPYYMSPEQCSGINIDQRSDIYSVGCSLFETLTGYVPFDSESALDVALLHRDAAPPRLGEVAAKLQFSDTIEEVVGRCLEKNPANRYQSAAQLSQDLVRIKEGRELAYRPPVSIDEGDNVDVDITNNRLTYALVLLAIVVTGLGCIVWFTVLFDTRKLSTTVANSSKSVSQNTLVTPGADLAANPPPGAAANEDMALMLDHSDDIVVSFNKVPEVPPQSRLDTTPFLSRENGETGPIKVFHFPADAFLGCIYGQTFNQRAPARGTVRVAADQEVVYCPSRLAVRYPQYLKRFRRGDIDEVRLLNLANDDQMLDVVSAIPGITSLRVSSCRNLSSHGMRFLPKFKEIISFDASDTGLNAAGLARARDWSSLQSFGLAQSRDVTPMLEALNKASHLRALDLGSNKLTDEDCRLIAAYPHLISLTLTCCKLTGHQYRLLSQCKNLLLIDLTGCAITPDVIGALQQLKTLKVVKLGMLPPKIREGIAERLPHVDIQ